MIAVILGLAYIFLLGMGVGAEIVERRNKHLIDAGLFLAQSFRDIDARCKLVGPEMQVTLIAEARSVRGRYALKIEKEDA